MSEELERVYNERTDKTYVKYRTDDGNIQYRTVGSQGNRFISESAYNQLKGSNSTSTIPTDRRKPRKQKLKEKYPQYNNTTGLQAGKYDNSDPGVINSARTWMDNAELRESVRNDPTVETREEYNKALEAKARQLAMELEGVSDSDDRLEILKEYDVY